MRSRQLLFLLLVLISAPAVAQQDRPQDELPSADHPSNPVVERLDPPPNLPTKPTVSVVHTGQDPVGSQLAFAIRETLRRSAGFEFVSSTEEAVFHINVITVDPAHGVSSGDGHFTTAAVVLTMKNHIPYQAHDPQTWYPIFLNAAVVFVGPTRVDDQARAVVAILDESVENYKQVAKE